jgi:hypothetical protein
MAVISAFVRGPHSNYLLVFTAFAMVAAAAVRADEWLLDARARGRLLVAAAMAVVVLLPFLWPYYQVSRDQGFRSIDEVALMLQDGATTRHGRTAAYALWSRLLRGRTALFPGITAVVLAVVASLRCGLARPPRPHGWRLACWASRFHSVGPARAFHDPAAPRQPP